GSLPPSSSDVSRTAHSTTGPMLRAASALPVGNGGTMRNGQERVPGRSGVDGTTLGILLGLSFLPPLAFAVWVRNHEKHQRESMLAVLGMFAYGGTLGVAIALLIEQLGGGALG